MVTPFKFFGRICVLIRPASKGAPSLRRDGTVAAVGTHFVDTDHVCCGASFRYLRADVHTSLFRPDPLEKTRSCALAVSFVPVTGTRNIVFGSNMLPWTILIVLHF